MNRWKDYVVARSEDEALSALLRASGQARVIAGGTDLVVEFRDGRRHADMLVDIMRVPSFKRIALDAGVLSIGAAVTHDEVLRYLGGGQDGLPVLAQALRSIGSPQIRGQATVVGNLASGHGSADGGIALLALEADFVVLNEGGRRRVSVDDYYRAADHARIDSTREIIVELQVKAPYDQAVGAYARKGRRRGFCRATAGCAVVLDVDGGVAGAETSGGRIAKARIAVGPVLRERFRGRAMPPCTQCFSTCRMCRPVRLPSAEEYLAGRPIEEAVIARAAEVGSEAVTLRSSVVNGSSDYRRLVVRGLMERAIREAVCGALSRPERKARRV
ncbi:MAG: FAD binding domain-containing protein [Bacillota bacterium]